MTLRCSTNQSLSVPVGVGLFGFGDVFYGIIRCVLLPSLAMSNWPTTTPFALAGFHQLQDNGTRQRVLRSALDVCDVVCRREMTRGHASLIDGTDWFRSCISMT